MFRKEAYIAERIDINLANWLSSQYNEVQIIGYVHSVFKKVLNILSVEQNRLLSIGNSEVIMSPYMMKIEGFVNFQSLDLQLKQSKPICLIDNKLVIDNELEINFKKAERWNPFIDRFSPFSRLVFLKILQQISLVIEDKGIEGGFKTIWLSHVKNKQQAMTHLHEVELAKRFKKFSHLLEECKWENVYENAKQFAGLGLGLTPSGDDFLTGWLLTLHAFQHPLSRVFKSRKEEWLHFVKNRTTVVSYFMLEAAINGQGNEAVQELLYRIKEKETTIKQLMDKIVSLGSSSGTDMLVGIGFALELMLKTHRRDINGIQSHY